MPAGGEREARAGALARSGAGSLATLRTVRRVRDDLKDGLGGPRLRAVARRLRWLTGADGIALADLTSPLQWAGQPAPDQRVRELVDTVLHTEARSGRPPLVAVPLDVQDEVAGVLVVHGKVRMANVREAASLVMDALERGRLEASAEQAAQSEFRALRAEISPHFVYNALSVIASLVRSDPDRARDLMLDFADYIRYSLARHGEYTTVADEFHAIETYLALQRAVLGDRLRVQIRVAPEVLAVPVPYLVLQPLVENAIRHGLEPRTEAGLVQVRGEAEGSECVISVEDDGIGMDPGKAEAILAGRTYPDSVGLVNVDRRLRHVYGAWFGLVVETAMEAGTRVVVRVPMFQPGVMP
ncbi:two-component system LytT family sensor kinase [Tamaricihabitans halophyticus]|uniref:Two-component system LytT family sensor kinase n=1 Tax=Tamaricihabitans halophyticus TaxID=1262583 RepID=A0A4R2QYL7_9PSEU|nr:histidine kinase [Tamaricihabitans halophyticus]TCP55303.1 two-component system LytT family sensor kinase [Tamaricihabitans halophyticus]